MKTTFRLVRPNSEKPTAVYIDAVLGGKRRRIGTKLSIHPALWNKKHQRPYRTMSRLSKLAKEYPNIKSTVEVLEIDLNRLRDGIATYLAKCRADEDPETLEGLAEYIKTNRISHHKEAVAENLTDYMANVYLPGLESGKIGYKKQGVQYNYNQSTIKAKKQSFNAFVAFEEETNTRIEFKDIDLEWYDSFVRHQQDKGMKVNYIGRLVKDLKVVMTHAYDAGHHTNNAHTHKDFNSIREETHAIALSKEDIDKLHGVDLPKHLQHYRDVFLVGCYTALRYSDYSRLNPDHIYDGKHRFIKIVNEKTKHRVTIPIKGELWTILNQRGYFDRKRLREQKMNRHIKEICKMAGIDDIQHYTVIENGAKVKKQSLKYEMVTTHTARRTGATLMYKAGIDLLKIMSVTGHKSIKTFLKYIRVTEEEMAEDMANHPYFK